MTSSLTPAFALAAAVVLAASCSQTTTRLAGGQSQSRGEIRQIIDRLQPTTRFAPSVHEGKLWEATRTYMNEMFELETPAASPAGKLAAAQQVETKTYEWFEGNLGHQTRINARVASDPASANVKLHVTALLIEATPMFEDARSGAPLVYDWRLMGANPKIEQAVADGIMRRYLALVEGKPPPPLEFEAAKQPVPGLRTKPSSGAETPVGVKREG
jgi:hypothetical protein